MDQMAQMGKMDLKDAKVFYLHSFLATGFKSDQIRKMHTSLIDGIVEILAGGRVNHFMHS